MRTMLVLASLSALLLSGCGPYSDVRSTVTRVSIGPRVLLVPADDGASDGTRQVGSGEETTNAARDMLLAHGLKPQAATSNDLAAAIERAAADGFDDVLRIRLVEIEDNATNWSGRDDVVQVSLEAYDPATKDLRGAVTNREVNGWLNFIDHPATILIAPAVEAAVAPLYGWPAPEARFGGTAGRAQEPVPSERGATARSL